MAWIRSHRTAKGARRYEVCYRDADGRQRSCTFSIHKGAQAFKLQVECARFATHGRPPANQVPRRLAVQWGKGPPVAPLVSAGVVSRWRRSTRTGR